MKIALLSDIHGNLPALEAVAADLRQRGVERIANLGDHLSGPLLARETARYLMDRGWDSLAGNHDRQLLEFDARTAGASDACAHAQLGAAEFDWLRALRPTAWLHEELFACHGSPRSDCEYLLETVVPEGLRQARMDAVDARLDGIAAPLIVCGHTHVPRIVRNARGQLLVNPGSVGLPAYRDTVPYPHAVGPARRTRATRSWSVARTAGMHR